MDKGKRKQTDEDVRASLEVIEKLFYMYNIGILNQPSSELEPCGQQPQAR